MNSIPVLGIPHYNRPDLLLRCIQSIDYPVDKLVIVQNGKDEDMPNVFALPSHVKQYVHIRHPNTGVAGSWNEVIMLFPAPWWMLVNNDILFTPGDLERMSRATWTFKDEHAILFGNHACAFFTITKRGVKNVGLFDWALRPAYYEDNEWMWRLKCVGETYTNIENINSIHGENVNGVMHGSRTINATPQLLNENSRTYDNNHRYYVAKTGGEPGQEKFTHPFNNPAIPLNYLPYDPEIWEQQQWKV